MTDITMANIGDSSLINAINKLMAVAKNYEESILNGEKGSNLFGGADEKAHKESLIKALTDLQYVVSDSKFPEAMTDFSINNMSCIEHDVDSDFVKKNPNAKPKDTWWSHLTVTYEHDGQYVPHDIIAIGNAYLDLAKRDKGKLADSYGKNIVNVYIPIEVYKKIHNIMQDKSGFEYLGDGKEIVDREQGLVSVLCQKGIDQTKSLKATVYGANNNDEGELIGYRRTNVDLEELYKTAMGHSDYKVCNGIAFLRFGLNFTCDPGTYSPKDTLPTSVMPVIKAKIFGFHVLSAAGKSVKQITYGTRSMVTY